jgi:hypothetical protein
MPPEEPNCLVVLSMEMHGEDAAISGERVFAFADDVTTVSWYTDSQKPPPGYESILDGLVFVRSNTIDSKVQIDRVIPTKVGSEYQWNDTSRKDGLMIAVALPIGHSIGSCNPQLEEAKRFGDRIAVYWYLLPANPSDHRVSVKFSVKPSHGSIDDEVERLNRAVVLSRSRPAAAKYDVALSFAGEDREYVHSVAEALAAKGVKVFYDNFEEADLWGKDLYDHLVEIYGSRARFTVMFISAAYGEKLWTNHERKAAQSKAFTQNSEYILPVRIDDTVVPGMLPTTCYEHASKKTPDQLASLLIEKLTRLPTK